MHMKLMKVMASAVVLFAAALPLSERSDAGGVHD